MRGLTLGCTIDAIVPVVATWMNPCRRGPLGWRLAFLVGGLPSCRLAMLVHVGHDLSR